MRLSSSRVLLTVMLLIAICTSSFSSEGNNQSYSQSINQYGNDYSIWTSSNVSGNWAGIRENMSAKGVEFEFVYTGEPVSNMTGGIEQKTIYHDNYDLITAIDAELLMGIKGGEFNVYFLGNSGESPSGIVGDLQVSSNIDTDPAWKLYEAWYQQNLFDDKLSLLVGLYDLNSEFDVIETGGHFLNSSHGIGADYSQSGANGPSIFPVTSLTLRGKYAISDKLTVQAAILDGAPGDPEKVTGTHLKFNDEHGLLNVGEIYYSNDGEVGSYCKYSFGGWMYTEEFEEVMDPSLSGTGNSGLYVMAERELYKESEFSSQGLSAFARFGMANSTYNQIGNYIGFGAAYTGLLPGRDEDVIGLAIAIASNGKDFKDSIEATNAEVDNSETSIEFVYITELLPWLVVQPDIQYIINPGTNPNLDNALAVSVRFQISF